MKIVEDYAQRVAKKKVDESKESIVINLCEEGFKIADIARIADVSKDFSQLSSQFRKIQDFKKY